MDFDEWWGKFMDECYDEELGLDRAPRYIAERAFAAGQDSIESRLNQSGDAIEAPSQEPVAYWNGGAGFALPWEKKDDSRLKFVDMCNTPLYTTPPDAAAQIAELKKLLAEAYADADEVLRPQIAQLRAELEREKVSHEAWEQEHLKEVAKLQAENAEARKLLATRVEASRLDEAQDQIDALLEMNGTQAKTITQLTAAARMAIEMIETNAHERRHVRWALKDALGEVK